jgi:hypothetical protein
MDHPVYALLVLGGIARGKGGSRGGNGKNGGQGRGNDNLGFHIVRTFHLIAQVG